MKKGKKIVITVIVTIIAIIGLIIAYDKFNYKTIKAEDTNLIVDKLKLRKIENQPKGLHKNKKICYNI